MFQAMELFGRPSQRLVDPRDCGVRCWNSTQAADTLTWHTNENRVSCGHPFGAIAASARRRFATHRLAGLSGVQYRAHRLRQVQRSAVRRSPALSVGQLNFALVPQTNSRSRLYVFHSSQGNATMLVEPGDLNSQVAQPVPPSRMNSGSPQSAGLKLKISRACRGRKSQGESRE